MPAPFVNIDEAARLVRAGKLVAFPTDTVYGVAGAADGGLGENPDCAALRAFKGERKEPFSLHAGGIPAALRMLGPRTLDEESAIWVMCGSQCTVVLRWHRRGLGIRIVTHEVGSGFLEAAGVPILASSANLHGRPTLHDPREIAQLPGIAAVLPADLPPRREPSTVVRLLPTGLQVLREGALKPTDLMMTSILLKRFVCLGNLNRSAFAHRLVEAMQTWLAARIPGFIRAWQAESSGLIASPDMKVPEPMQRAAAAYGVDLSTHRPRRFVARKGEPLICMGDDVAEIIAQAAGFEYLNLRVADPMGGPAQGYADAARAIVNGLRHALLAEWAPNGDAQLEAEFGKLFWGV